MMLQVDRFPKPGETLSAQSMTTSAGGKVLQMQLVMQKMKYMYMTPAEQQSVSMACMQGANQAAAAASLGYPTYFLGQVM